MKIFQTKLCFLFLTSFFLFTACGKNDGANQNSNVAQANANNANSNSTKDDGEEFAKIVTLPAVPEEVTWRETNAENSKKLIAVLKFSPQDAQTIAAQAEKYKPAAPAELDAEDWFPPELVAKSQEGGDDILKGNTYAANDFFSETYKNGKLTRIGDTTFFVLELSN